MNKHLAEYNELLKNIYGESIVSSFLDVSNSSMKFKEDTDQLNSFIDNFERSETEGCPDCKSMMKCIFRERKMDFPSWLGFLDFTKENLKKIMIIGEDVSPTIPSDINIAYDLVQHKIHPDGNVEGIERNKLWILLKKIFSGRLQLILKNVYITDISKCSADKNNKDNNNPHKKIWSKCSKKYLEKEIELIRPKLIIFQGKTAIKYVEEIFGDKMVFLDAGEYFGINTKENRFLKFGTIGKIRFFKMVHSSKMASGYWHYNDKLISLVNDKILPLLIEHGGKRN